MIRLSNINWENFNEFMSLRIKDEQEGFAAPVAYSLSQSYVALLNNVKPPLSYAIYNDDVIIGHTLIMYYNGEDNIYGNDNAYVINRFLIDEKYQGKGLGKTSFNVIIDLIRSFPQGEGNSVYLSYNKKNINAENLYKQFGFIETGRILPNEEVIAKLELN